MIVIADLLENADARERERSNNNGVPRERGRRGGKQPHRERERESVYIQQMLLTYLYSCETSQIYFLPETKDISNPLLLMKRGKHIPLRSGCTK